MLPIVIAYHLKKLPKRQGRPNHKHSFRYIGKILIAEDAIKERAEQIWKARKNMDAIQQRSLPSPMEQAAEAGVGRIQGVLRLPPKQTLEEWEKDAEKNQAQYRENRRDDRAKG